MSIAPPSQFSLPSARVAGVSTSDLSPACQRELSRHQEGDLAEILRRARSIAGEAGRTLMAEDIQNAARSLTASRSGIYPAAIPPGTNPAAKPSASLSIKPNRTLLPLMFVQVALGMDEDDALLLAEKGILPAFNIGRGQVKRVIRVLSYALLSYQPGQGRSKVPLDDVISQAVPAPGPATGAKQTVRSTQLRDRFCCTQCHLEHLIRDGELRECGKTTSNSPILDYQSIVQFLQRRAL